MNFSQAADGLQDLVESLHLDEKVKATTSKDPEHRKTMSKAAHSMHKAGFGPQLTALLKKRGKLQGEDKHTDAALDRLSKTAGPEDHEDPTKKAGRKFLDKMKRQRGEQAEDAHTDAALNRLAKTAGPEDPEHVQRRAAANKTLDKLKRRMKGEAAEPISEKSRYEKEYEKDPEGTTLAKNRAMARLSARKGSPARRDLLRKGVEPGSSGYKRLPNALKEPQHRESLDNPLGWDTDDADLIEAANRAYLEENGFETMQEALESEK